MYEIHINKNKKGWRIYFYIQLSQVVPPWQMQIVSLVA
jgi:hypothetical protein